MWSGVQALVRLSNTGSSLRNIIQHQPVTVILFSALTGLKSQGKDSGRNREPPANGYIDKGKVQGCTQQMVRDSAIKKTICGFRERQPQRANKTPEGAGA
ncbi:hypothetical protein F2P81_024097 [Scophthalmus maximus]|uniref:Uncharacterized protein n=1 Tax=Scophthalmus maximus TaxID=52904 RepID=A0A6A4RT38_SCOMX|nr:hypothetical protein F2P81_024097 [Scophthalmus maximus]